MPIPDYQSIMLPLLKHLGDGKVRSTQETLDVLAEKFDLSEEERKELLPSGQQPIFTNRVGWAKLYLRKAGLIEASERGQYKITYEGLNVLRQNPDRIDNRFLSKYPGFIEFTRGRKSEKSNQKKTETIEEEISNDKTPDEYLEYGYQKLRSDLANALIERIKDCPPAFFEKLVIELLLKMGYGGSRQEAGRTIGKSGDGGIDGIIKEDRLGLDVIYIQAKRWDGTIGSPEIHKFAGALQGQRAKKGIFITTSSFSKKAQEYVSKIESKIVLMDGETLANLMIDFDIGVSMIASYEIKKVDSDYFVQE